MLKNSREIKLVPMSDLTLTTGIKSVDRHSIEFGLITTAGTSNIHAGTFVRSLANPADDNDVTTCAKSDHEYDLKNVICICRELGKTVTRELESLQKKSPMSSFYVASIRTANTFYGVFIFRQDAKSAPYRVVSHFTKTGRHRVMEAFCDWLTNSYEQYQNAVSWNRFVKTDAMESRIGYPLGIVAFTKDGDNEIFGLNVETEDELLGLHADLKQLGRLPYFAVCLPKAECFESRRAHQVSIIEGEFGVNIYAGRVHK